MKEKDFFVYACKSAIFDKKPNWLDNSNILHVVDFELYKKILQENEILKIELERLKHMRLGEK